METINERIARWYDYCKAYGIPLTKIVIHPDDKAAAPATHEGLPVVALGEQP